MRPLAYLLSLCLALAYASCEDAAVTPEPSPIQRLLAEDSLARAGSGDSSLRHIAFDYENLNRVVWQKPQVLVERLGPLDDKTVVEVGSGTGFFTRRLARVAGRVIALDIDPGMLVLLDSLNQEELDSASYLRVDPRLVPPDDPKLGPGEGDAALVVNTYMYIRDGAAYLRRLAEGLQPGSRILIVDFKKKSTPVGPPLASRVPGAEVERALVAAGYEDVSVDDATLDYQYIVHGQRP